MLVRFECGYENFPKVQLEHVPIRGDAVEIFGSWYEVLSTGYETVIRKKSSGKTSVVQVAVCDIRKIVIINFQADKQDDKWKPHSEFCNKEETGSAEENICNTCLFKGKCPSENKKEVYELCETIKKQAELYLKNKEVAG